MLKDIEKIIFSFLDKCEMCKVFFILDKTKYYGNCCGEENFTCLFFKYDFENEGLLKKIVCQSCQNQLLIYSHEGPLCGPCFDQWVVEEMY